MNDVISLVSILTGIRMPWEPPALKSQDPSARQYCQTICPFRQGYYIHCAYSSIGSEPSSCPVNAIDIIGDESDERELNEVLDELSALRDQNYWISILDHPVIDSIPCRG